jgi:hypothetical protein
MLDVFRKVSVSLSIWRVNDTPFSDVDLFQ